MATPRCLIGLPSPALGVLATVPPSPPLLSSVIARKVSPEVPSFVSACPNSSLSSFPLILFSRFRLHSLEVESAVAKWTDSPCIVPPFFLLFFFLSFLERVPFTETQLPSSIPATVSDSELPRTFAPESSCSVFIEIAFHRFVSPLVRTSSSRNFIFINHRLHSFRAHFALAWVPLISHRKNHPNLSDSSIVPPPRSSKLPMFSMR